MLTDHDITEGLAAAFHDRADPLRATTVDPAGIFARGVRARRRHVAVRTAAASIGAALVAVVLAVNLSAGPGPLVAERPPGVLLAAAVVSPPPPGAAGAGMPRYYVTMDHFRPVAEVRDSATGKVLRKVALPRRIDPKMSQIAAAADTAVKVLVPYAERLDAVVLGGERKAVTGARADPRLRPVLRHAVDRFLTVPDPKLAVLRDSPRLFLAVRIRLTGPA